MIKKPTKGLFYPNDGTKTALKAFIEQRLSFTPVSRVGTAELYQAWRQWVSETCPDDPQPWLDVKQKTFSAWMTHVLPEVDPEVTRTQSLGLLMFRGVGLNAVARAAA